MGYKIGLDAKLYYQTTGTRVAWPATGAAPNLSEIDDAQDVTLNIEKSKAELKRRGSTWTLSLGALKSASIEYTLLYDAGDAAFAALRDAYLNNTVIAVAVLDGDSATAGTQGLWADFVVTNFSRNEPLEESLSANFTLEPAFSGAAHVDPEWVTVATS